MEGFWRIMKREMCYGKKYKIREELIEAIENILIITPTDEDKRIYAF